MKGEKLLALAKGNNYRPSSFSFSAADTFLALGIPRAKNPKMVDVGGPGKSVNRHWPPRLQLEYYEEADEQEIYLFDSDTGTKQATLEDKDVVTCLGVSPDSKYVIGGTETGNLVVWEVGEATLVHKIRCHHDQILAVAFKSDGTHVVTAGMDGLVRIWDFQALLDSLRTVEPK